MNRPARGERGYTLLELIITVAIIGIAAKFMLPGMDGWTLQRSFRNTLADLQRDIITAAQESEARNTTTRLLVVRAGDTYTITTYYSDPDAPATTCDATGNWTAVGSRTMEVSSQFEITGSGVGNVCFFRDGSSSGASYSVGQKDGGTEYGGATIEVSIATGIPDVQED